jgi:hypothetical protein
MSEKVANCWRHEQNGYIKPATQTLHGIDGTDKDYFVCDECASDFIEMYKKQTGLNPIVYKMKLS